MTEQQKRKFFLIDEQTGQKIKMMVDLAMRHSGIEYISVAADVLNALNRPIEKEVTGEQNHEDGPITNS